MEKSHIKIVKFEVENLKLKIWVQTLELIRKSIKLKIFGICIQIVKLFKLIRKKLKKLKICMNFRIKIKIKFIINKLKWPNFTNSIFYLSLNKILIWVNFIK